MASSSAPLHIIEDDDEFDWEAAVQAIDVACEATNAEKPTSISNFDSLSNFNPHIVSNPFQEIHKKGKFDGSVSSVPSTKQSTLDRFIGISSGNFKKSTGEKELSNGLCRNNSNCDNSGVAECEDVEMLNGFIKIDPEAAKTWIYPVNYPRRDYQFSITKTALFSNTLVVLPTGLGKTLIAAVVMYNFFRWFPEGKIVFAAPSRPLVLQQIEACHKIGGIPQEWTIDLTGQTTPAKRADIWKNKRVFFVTPQVFERDIRSGSCLVKHLVCLVIDEAHRATGNYASCVAVRQLMDTPVQLRILALSATPGSDHKKIQEVINNLQISTLECRNESDSEVVPYVNERKIELFEVPMGDVAVEINNMILQIVRPFVSRLYACGVLPKRGAEAFSPYCFLDARDKFRQAPPPHLHHSEHREIESYLAVLVTLFNVRKLLSSNGIRPAIEMVLAKLKEGSLARVSRNEVFLKAKRLMQQYVSHGALSPKLTKMLEVLTDHFILSTFGNSGAEVKNPQDSRVIIFSNYRDSVRDILDALKEIRDIVKATEFIGQSSAAGKTLKGQSQKVQQEVLQKFRAGGFNVIVATSIGEEGLDIVEVDLVICFDCNVSPLRMVQRMGRTGRKHEGRVVLLACEGMELNSYKQKQAKGKTVNKHLRNGGMNSFDFHSSPRMVPHVFKPEVQFLEMSIEEFVPRCKKVKDDNPVSVPAYETKLTDAETDLLAKYFATTGEIAWRPSLIAFPHFQAFPSKVQKVLHSSRTGMLIDTMQYLQGLTFSKDSNNLSEEDEDISDPCLRVEGKIIEVRFNDPVEEKLKTEDLETDTELEEISKDMHVEDLHKQIPSVHTFLFSSEFVSVDDVGNVLVLSLPELPLGSNFKSFEDSRMDSVHHLMPDSNDNEENNIQAKTSPLRSKSLEIENFLESSQRNPDEQNGELLCEDHSVVDERPLTPLADESSNDFRDYELSPRLTNFIKSGIVPESPVNNSGTSNGHRDDVTVSHDEKAIEDGNLNKINAPCSNGNGNNIQTPVLDWNKDVAEEVQTPLARTSNTSSSREWLLDSGVKAETVEQQCKFRRLRKHGDLNRKIHPESKEQNSRRRKFRNSRGSDCHSANKLVKGKKKRAKDIALYVEEEAEVSSEDMASDDEEDEHDNSSYEDSFINDDVNPTSAATQADITKTDMMAIYRRSLLSQSPFPRLPDFCTKSSPDSVVQSSRLDQSGSSSGTKHDDDTPQTGLNSTARNSQYACNDGISSEMVESKVESRKRKLSYQQARTVTMVNLENEFALLNETPVENKSMQIQVDRTEENRDVFDDDDGFYEGIDLDAVEEEAAKLLGCKTECSMQKTATVIDPIQENFGILGSPSFDLGF